MKSSVNTNQLTKIAESLKPLASSLNNDLLEAFDSHFHRSPSPNDRITIQELSDCFIMSCNGQSFARVTYSGVVNPIL